MRFIRPVFFFIFFGLTILFGIWGVINAPRRFQERPLRLIEAATPPTVIGKWAIQIEAPRYLRAGEAAIVRLSLLPVSEPPDTPQAAYPTLPGDVSFPGLLAASTMVAEARLDLAGMEIRPDQPISEPLLPGKPALFFWSVRATQPGDYAGVAWLHLRLISPQGENVIPLSAQEIRFQVRTLWGFSANAARWLSLLWGILTFLLGFPYLRDVVLWLGHRAREAGKAAESPPAGKLVEGNSGLPLFKPALNS
ncbi:MAG: hypothetical protein ACK4VW_06710 [Anaerolineales bacterium]